MQVNITAVLAGRMMRGMTEATAEATSLNGTAPAGQPEPPCEDCVTSGEKALAVVAALFGAFIIVMALDMFLGGRIGGYVTDKVRQ